MFFYIFCRAQKKRKKLRIFWLFFALRKKYRKYLWNIFVKRKDFAVVFPERKKYQKVIAKTNQKIYGNRKYLRYILLIARNCANINNIFVKRKRYQKKKRKKRQKKLWLLYGGKLVHNQSVNTFTLLSLIHILNQSIQGNWTGHPFSAISVTFFFEISICFEEKNT